MSEISIAVDIESNISLDVLDIQKNILSDVKFLKGLFILDFVEVLLSLFEIGFFLIIIEPQEKQQIIKFIENNKNSGIFMYVGLGYMQHKINIYDVDKTLPQITGNLKKGYDRLTGGPAAEQFIGYMFLARNRLVNWFAGIEIQEGFTTGLRGYQYDLMGTDNKQRHDILFGIKLGWMLPLYQKAPKEFYYN